PHARARGHRDAREADRRSGEGRAEPMTSRPLARGLAVAFAAVILAAPVAAAFPTRPVELTVLFGAGSAADLPPRKLAELAAKDLGQPATVVNRTGARG